MGLSTSTIDLTTLAGLDAKPAEIPGFGPIVADVARKIAASQHDSEWRVTFTDPDGGAVVWNGTTRRRPTVTQRRYLEARHRNCVFPGCRMPAIDSDIDHTRDSMSAPMIREAAEADVVFARALIDELSDRVMSFIAEIPGSAFATVRQRVARHMLDQASDVGTCTPGDEQADQWQRVEGRQSANDVEDENDCSCRQGEAGA